MAATPSTMQLPIGSTAPDFSLPNSVSGQVVTRASMTGGAGLLVMFICNHCPFVVHVRDVLAQIALDYGARGIAVVAINSNDAEAYPQDGPEHMKTLAESLEWSFPYLFDADQSVAKAYRAACTPDLYLFDGDHQLVYRGQLDGSRPGNDVPVTGEDLAAALDALLAGEPVPSEQKPSLGCNIKWAPGNEPTF